MSADFPGKMRGKKGKRIERLHDESVRRDQAVTACPSCLSCWSSLPSACGLTPPRGQAPVDDNLLHVSPLQCAPGIPRRTMSAPCEWTRHIMVRQVHVTGSDRT